MKKLITVFILAFCTSLLMHAQNQLYGPLNRVAIVRGISPDGKYVVGKYDQNPKPAFLWNVHDNVLYQLGTTVGEAFDVTNDSIVVGLFMDPDIIYNGNPVYSAGYWKDNVWTGLGLGVGTGEELRGDAYGSSAGAITGDGITVVGFSKSNEQSSFYSFPYSWTKTEDGWDEQLWSYPDGADYGAALAGISNDRSIAVGWTTLPGNSTRQAIKWTSATEYELSFPEVGYSEYICISPNGNYAGFRYSGQCGVHNLVTDEFFLIPEGFLINDVSDNGYAVGAYRPANGIDKGFIWHKDLGFMDFKEFIETFASDITLPAALVSLDPTNTYNYALNAISPDGLNITIWTNGFMVNRGQTFVLSLENPIEILPYPVNLTAEVIVPNRDVVTLNWDAPEDLGEYILTGYAISRDGTEIVEVDENTTTYNDEDVDNGYHNYIVKAIYAEGQSRSSNVAIAEIVDSYELPFFDNFSSNGFETNFWNTEKYLGSVNSPSWIVYTDAGIYASSGATIEINNSIGEFSSALISKFFDGTEFSNLYLSFATKSDYFLQTGQEPTMDTLYIEIFNPETQEWSLAYEYIYAETMTWKGDLIDLTEFAAGNFFKIRFRIDGVNNTTNLKRIYFDEVSIMTDLPDESVKPINILSRESDDIVQLAWQNTSSELYGLTYSTSEKIYSIGNAGANFIAVNNYESADLEIYEDLYLHSITAYINKKVTNPDVATALKLAVFKDGQRIVDSNIESFNNNSWNTFELETPILLNDINNLKFGIEVVNHASNEEPIGCDGTRTYSTGKGDVYSEDGGETWLTLTDAGKINNWCIIGNVASQESTATRDGSIVGYNVYYEEEKINDHLIFGQSYLSERGVGCYTVRSYTFDYGISAESETECAEKIINIERYTPAQDAENVAVNTTISVEFSTTISEQDLSGITISPSVTNVVPSINGRILTISHDVFEFEEEYTVTIPVGSIEGYNEIISWSFTTSDETAAPTIVSRTPNIDESDIALNAEVLVTFDMNITGINTGINNVKITYGENNTELTGVVATVNNDVLNIAHNNFNYGTEYTVIIPDGALENYIGEISWSFTTLAATAAPEISSRTPAINADEVALDAEVSVTFNMAITGQNNLSNVKIVYGENNTELTGVNATIDGSTLKIAHNEFGYNTEYTVIIPDGSIENYIGEIRWSFTTLDAPAVPAILSRTPDMDENEVALNAEVSVTFSMSIVEQNNGLDNVKITYGEDNTELTGVVATIDNAVLKIAHDEFDYNTEYTVTIPAGSITDYSDAITWKFITEEFVSVSQSQNTEINIYPNPSSGLININVSENSIVKLIDVSGRLIDTYQIDAYSSMTINQPAGIYYVNIESKGKMSTHKLIIQ